MKGRHLVVSHMKQNITNIKYVHRFKEFLTKVEKAISLIFLNIIKNSLKQIYFINSYKFEKITNNNIFFYIHSNNIRNTTEFLHGLKVVFFLCNRVAINCKLDKFRTILLKPEKKRNIPKINKINQTVK